jgi:predicted ester cyclase
MNEISRSCAQPGIDPTAPESVSVTARDSARENVAVVTRYLAAISGHAKPDSVLDLYIADDDLRQQVAFFEKVFPGYVLVADDVIAQGDKVAVRARLQGTHAGDLMGIAPTMKGVNVPFIIIYRIAGARIAEHWMSIDQSELLKQLGVDG